MTITSLDAWLEERGFEAFVPQFQEIADSVDDLKCLSEELVDELTKVWGMKLLPAMRLKKCLEELRSGQGSVARRRTLPRPNLLPPSAPPPPPPPAPPARDYQASPPCKLTIARKGHIAGDLAELLVQNVVPVHDEVELIAEYYEKHRFGPPELNAELARRGWTLPDLETTRDYCAKLQTDPAQIEEYEREHDIPDKVRDRALEQLGWNIARYDASKRGQPIKIGDRPCYAPVKSLVSTWSMVGIFRAVAKAREYCATVASRPSSSQTPRGSSGLP